MDQFNRKCGGESGLFHVTDLEFDEETGNYRYVVQYPLECETCFFIEECTAKVIKIVSKELGVESDEYIIESGTEKQ